jgi:pyridoxine 5-phosphate synthase
MRLGINVDHVATVRQARLIGMPDPVEAAMLAEAAGADGITVHLREDRRHIQERDVALLRERLTTKLNLEMAATTEMTERARQFRPDDVCLVPERRAELTTEGGLDVRSNRAQIGVTVARLQAVGIRVNLFVDPDEQQIEVSREIAAHGVEIHTGAYSNASGAGAVVELDTIRRAARFAASLGLEVHGGHGLNLINVQPVAAIDEMVELNIGHSIVARAIMVGMTRAVAEMKNRIVEARKG